MPADRRLYVFKVSEAAWNTAATEVPAGTLAGRPRAGLEVRRAMVGSDRVLGIVVEVGDAAAALDLTLPGSDDGFEALFVGPIDAGADPFVVEMSPTDAAKAALGSATPIS